MLMLHSKILLSVKHKFIRHFTLAPKSGHRDVDSKAKLNLNGSHGRREKSALKAFPCVNFLTPFMFAHFFIVGGNFFMALLTLFFRCFHNNGQFLLVGAFVFA